MFCCLPFKSCIFSVWGFVCHVLFGCSFFFGPPCSVFPLHSSTPCCRLSHRDDIVTLCCFFVTEVPEKIRLVFFVGKVAFEFYVSTRKSGTVSAHIDRLHMRTGTYITPFAYEYACASSTKVFASLFRVFRTRGQLMRRVTSSLGLISCTSR